MLGMSYRFARLLLTASLLSSAALPLATAPQSATAQSTTAQSRRSPVAPNVERVKAVVQEAYNKFRGDTGVRMPTTYRISPKSIPSCSGSPSFRPITS
jgi:hypothetical protein